jgi:DNA-binding transcriptional regulator YiaG
MTKSYNNISSIDNPNIVRYNITMKEWTSEDLKALRKKYKLSQKALGDLIGVTEQYVYYLERGMRTTGKPLKLLLNYVEADLKENGE